MRARVDSLETEPSDVAQKVELRAGAPELRIIGECHVEIWGLDAQERIRRTFKAAGVSRTTTSQPEDFRNGVIVVGAEWVLDVGLVKAAVQRPGVMLLAAGVEGGAERIVMAHLAPGTAPTTHERVANLIGRAAATAETVTDLRLETVDAESLGTSYNNALRKRERPYVGSLLETPLDELERCTFGASYKGVTDFVTKWVWPIPARAVTRWAAKRRITPNSVTAASLVLVLIAIVLFAQGQFLAGVIVGWAMTFLDTVDGKLARVTHTSSKWGNVFDHGIDLIHPPFWWAAWWWGLGGAASGAPLEVTMWIIVAGYVAGRLIEGAFLKAFVIEMHVWRPIDSLMRQITARRNPNLALLSVAVILGSPAIGFYVVAGWTVICIAFHLVRLAQAFVCRVRGQAIGSWLAEPRTRAG